MIFDKKVDGLIQENGVHDEREVYMNFIVDRRNVVYYMKFKFYRMPYNDFKRRIVRLVETDHMGNYLYDKSGEKN